MPETPEPTTEALVERAEAAAREETQAIRKHLVELAEHAKEHAATCRRLTECKAEADRLHKAIGQAVSGLETAPRPPDPGNGEAVDMDHLERVKSARAEEVPA